MTMGWAHICTKMGRVHRVRTVDILFYDVVEALCYVVDIGQTDCEKLCTQLTKAYVAETACISCY